MTVASRNAGSQRGVRLPIVVPGDRPVALVPAAVIGGLCIVAGGLLAAVTAPSASEKASWAAAYLVLVSGVAQVGIGLGQAAFNGSASKRTVAAQLVSWNVGNACVMAGTLLALTALVDLGGLVLLVALLLLVPGLGPVPLSASRGVRWLSWAYRGVVLLLLISIPVGLLLARLRS